MGSKYPKINLCNFEKNFTDHHPLSPVQTFSFWRLKVPYVSLVRFHYLQSFIILIGQEGVCQKTSNLSVLAQKSSHTSAKTKTLSI